MEIRLLRNFLGVARAGTLSAAAEILNLSQPALSRQMAALEENLGTSLFIRAPRKLQLTGDGMRLRKRAEEIIELVDRTCAEFKLSGPEISGDIYLGSGETWVLGLVAEVMQEMRQSYPNVRFHIFSGDGDEVAEKLNNGILDFGLFIEPANVSGYDSLKLPQVDTWGALLPRSHPLASKASVSPEDLWSEPLIISKQKFMESHISRWMRRDFSDLNIVATYSLLYNASVMVRKGLGIALGLDRLINVESDNELCFRPCNPFLTVGVYFAWKKQKLLSIPAEMFLKMMREKFINRDI